MERAAEPGGLLGPGGPFALSPEQLYSLRHRADLLGGTSEDSRVAVLRLLATYLLPMPWPPLNWPGGGRLERKRWTGGTWGAMQVDQWGFCMQTLAVLHSYPGWRQEQGRSLACNASLPYPALAAVEEVQEMARAVRGGLEAASGHGGWRCELVGGGRRSSAVHDAGERRSASGTAPAQVACVHSFMLEGGRIGCPLDVAWAAAAAPAPSQLPHRRFAATPPLPAPLLQTSW